MSQIPERVAQLQQRLRDRGLVAAILRLPENVLLATHYLTQITGGSLLFVSAETDPTLLVPEYEIGEAAESFAGDIRGFPVIRHDGPRTDDAMRRHLADLADEHETHGRGVGFEGSFEAVAPPVFAGEPFAVGAPTQQLIRTTQAASELVDISPDLEELRAVKTEFELDKLLTVNEIAMLGLEAFKRHARPGITEVALAAEVEAAILRDGHGHRGARVVRAWATISSGPKTALGWQYFRSGTRRLERDDVVMIEIGTMADGYWADHTRTVVAGRATRAQHAALAAARAALAAAFAEARPGANGASVDAAARAACRDHGFEQFPHHTGHGVGFRYHESRPSITPGSADLLLDRMLIAVEPGIYSQALGGFRWEDNGVVSVTGTRVLATSDYGLD